MRLDACKLSVMVQFLYKMPRLGLMFCSVFVIIVSSSFHNLNKLGEVCLFSWGRAMSSVPHICIWKGRIVVILVLTQNSISDCGNRGTLWVDLVCLLFMPTDVMPKWKSKSGSSIAVPFKFAIWFSRPCMCVNLIWCVFLLYLLTIKNKNRKCIKKQEKVICNFT